MSPSEVSTALGLSALKNRTWAIFKTSAIKGDGLEQAMEWYGTAHMYTRLYNCIAGVHDDRERESGQRN